MIRDENRAFANGVKRAGGIKSGLMNTNNNSNSGLNRLVRLLVFLVLGAGLALVAKNWQLVHPQAVQEWVQSAGVFGPLVFVLLFAVAAVLLIPATVMVLAGGAMFGPLLGTVYNLIGATLGAVFAFLISRYLAREWAQRRAGQRLRFMMDGVRDEGWKFVLLVRLAGVPYFVLNYALGLTPLGLLPYTVASALGMVASVIAMTYAGYVGFEAFSGGENLSGKIITAIALIALTALIPVMMRILRRRPESRS